MTPRPGIIGSWLRIAAWVCLASAAGGVLVSLLAPRAVVDLRLELGLVALAIGALLVDGWLRQRNRGGEVSRPAAAARRRDA